MEELLAQTGYKIHGLKQGETVEGTIASISPNEVLIDIGAKSEAIVAGRELTQAADFIKSLKVGDRVPAYVLVSENEAGQIILSLRQAVADFRWAKAVELLKSGQPIQVRGLEANRGGLIVDCLGLRGFIPSSHLAAEHVGCEHRLINAILTTKVIEVDRAKNRLVLSESQVLTPEEEEKRKKTWEKTKVGDKVKGEVTAVLPFGVFVNVGHVEGLIHISEIAWEKVEDPASFFKVGDKIEAKVLGKEEETRKFQLSVKQLTADPWAKVAQKYQKNQTVKGKVVKKEVFGAFVEIEEKVKGLLHISKIPPDTTLAIGEEVECVIESVDAEKKRISLTLLPKEKPVGYK